MHVKNHVTEGSPCKNLLWRLLKDLSDCRAFFGMSVALDQSLLNHQALILPVVTGTMFRMSYDNFCLLLLILCLITNAFSQTQHHFCNLGCTNVTVCYCLKHAYWFYETIVLCLINTTSSAVFELNDTSVDFSELNIQVTPSLLRRCAIS